MLICVLFLFLFVFVLVWCVCDRACGGVWRVVVDCLCSRGLKISKCVCVCGVGVDM